MTPAHPAPLFALIRAGTETISGVPSLAKSRRTFIAALFTLMKQLRAAYQLPFQKISTRH
jgi:hypothetical protein